MTDAYTIRNMIERQFDYDAMPGNCGCIPRYEHDCDACIFLGVGPAFPRTLNHSGMADWYLCPSEGGTILARMGDDPPDYRSLTVFSLGGTYAELSGTAIDAITIGLLAVRTEWDEKTQSAVLKAVPYMGTLADRIQYQKEREEAAKVASLDAIINLNVITDDDLPDDLIGAIMKQNKEKGIA